MLYMQCQAISNAQFGAKIRPCIRIRANTVMDMQGGQVPLKTRRKSMQQVQQHDRVHAAAQTKENVTVLRKKRPQSSRDSVR
jgi:hypothetical protein